MKNSTICRTLSASLILFSLFIGCSTAQEENIILPGAYQVDQYIDLLEDKHVGIVANHTSLISNTHLCDSLLKRGIQINTIFAPEHGFWGKVDAGAFIGDVSYGRDSIYVVSLYGKKKKPDSSDMSQIDMMVFDLQDVGARFYTYLSTLHYVMEACAKNNVPLIVLDRPNPIGFYIDGPILEKKYTSFVGMHPVPIVFGMTIGEYARMINGEYWLKDSIQCKLTVIPCDNYDHNSKYALPINPSPNLPTMSTIYLYPSLALFEGTVATIGKGTDFPFQVIGHPEYPDQNFSFIPSSRKGTDMQTLFRDKTCYGIDLRNIPEDSLRNLRSIDLSYIFRMYKALNYGDKFFNDFFIKLAGTAELKKQIIEGISEEEIRKSWQPGLEKFKKIRAKYLLYPDFNK